MVEAADEQRHEPGDGVAWQEAWGFDFVTADAALAGYARLALVPAARAAWYWAALTGRGRPLMALRHHELRIPRRWPLEVRGEGVWSAVICETPLEHWTVGLEAFAVAFDEPEDAWGDERGELVPLGFDLEWESNVPAEELRVPAEGYVQECSVFGEVLVGDRTFEVEARGMRTHTWGVHDWWGPGWTTVAGRPSTAAPSVVARAPVLVPDPDRRRAPARVLRAVVEDGAHFTWAEVVPGGQ